MIRMTPDLLPSLMRQRQRLCSNAREESEPFLYEDKSHVHLIFQVETTMSSTKLRTIPTFSQAARNYVAKKVGNYPFT